MSLKGGSGRTEGAKWDSHRWSHVRARLRTTDRDVGAFEQIQDQIHDRVAEVFATQDAVRMAELDRLARLGPDPDEDTSEDPTALRWPCEACGVREGHLPQPRFGAPQARGVARLCHECRAAGYRSTRCECGKPLHHRDYASNSKGGRTIGTRCGECRRKLRQEFGYSDGRRVAR